jgi:hypothetical protein
MEFVLDRPSRLCKESMMKRWYDGYDFSSWE